jgi:beta-N-acetylhexosaminidase
MKRHKLSLIILVVLIVTVFSACNGKAKNPDIRGAVTSITQGEKGITVLVEGKLEQDTSFDKASVFIDNKVPVSDKDGNKLTPADIKQGDTVEIIFTGEVRESYPVQADAKSVKILIKAVQDAVLF